MPKRTDISTILIIGAGPIVIGQACEFDYSGTQAVKTLKEEGYRIVLVNSNPATIMTDPELADATYIEPITPEIVAKIIEKERHVVPGGFALLPTMGGQTALNCALSLRRLGTLAKFDVKMIGATADAIDKAEDREDFGRTMQIVYDADTEIHARTYASRRSLEETKTLRSRNHRRDRSLPAILGGVSCCPSREERHVRCVGRIMAHYSGRLDGRPSVHFKLCGVPFGACSLGYTRKPKTARYDKPGLLLDLRSRRSRQDDAPLRYRWVSSGRGSRAIRHFANGRQHRLHYRSRNCWETKGLDLCTAFACEKRSTTVVDSEISDSGARIVHYCAGILSIACSAH